MSTTMHYAAWAPVALRLSRSAPILTPAPNLTLMSDGAVQRTRGGNPPSLRDREGAYADLRLIYISTMPFTRSHAPAWECIRNLNHELKSLQKHQTALPTRNFNFGDAIGWAYAFRLLPRKILLTPYNSTTYLA